MENSTLGDWDMLPKGHPLVMINNGWEELPQLLEHLSVPEKIKELQRKNYSWWNRYVEDLQQMVADTIG